MDVKLKQRIVGVIILIALLSFCLSMLIKGYHKDTQQPPSLSPSKKADIQPQQQSKTQTLTPSSSVLPPAKTPSSSANAPNNDIFPTPAPDSSLLHPLQASTQSLTEKTSQTAKQIKNMLNETEKLQTLSMPEKPYDIKKLAAQKLDAQVPVLENKLIKPVNNEAKNKPKIKKSNTANNDLHKIPPRSHQQINLIKIQAGTFSQPENAKNLINKLHQKGFSAHAETVNTAQGKMTKVIITEKNLTRKSAEALQRKLEKTFHLSGIIISSPVSL